MGKAQVYVTRKLPEQAMNYLSEHCTVKVWQDESAVPYKVLATEISSVSGILTMLTDTVDDTLLAQAPQLKVVSNMAVGFDNIDITAATERGIMVTNTPGVLTEATADLAWALLMAAARRIPEGDRLVRNGDWHGWGPLFMCGQDVYGTTLGIVGMGRIGLAVARRAKGFGMRVIYNKRTRDLTAEQEIGLEYVSFEELLRQSDYVSVHCPLTEQTKNMLGKEQFALMKPTAILVNTARGAVVDEEALYQALKARQIWAAGLDVFQVEPIVKEHKLLDLPNVVVAPHVGSATFVTRTKMAMIAAQNVVEALAGQVPANLLNPDYAYHSNQ